MTLVKAVLGRPVDKEKHARLHNEIVALRSENYTVRSIYEHLNISRSHYYKLLNKQYDVFATEAR